MQREQLIRLFFLGFLAFLVYQVLHILSPFFTGILGAIVIALIFFPVHDFIFKIFRKKRPNLAAGISTALLLLLLVVPFLWLTWVLSQEVADLYPVIKKLNYFATHWQESSLFRSSWFGEVWQKFSNIPGVETAKFKLLFKKVSDQTLLGVLEVARTLPTHIFKLVINVCVMHFVLFFLFRDGKIMFEKIKYLVPMEAAHKEQIFNRIYITLTAIVRGVFLVALVQGILCFIGFLIVGLNSALLLGFITILAALIPFVGATVVWLPIALYFLYQGILWKGIFLLIWGGTVVGLVDNFLRVVLIGGGAKLPILVIFFGLLGGIKVYGPKGIFLGPLAVALLMACVQIYRDIYIGASKK